jgi:aminoglycoside phosphotransferase (APT) family kinase protein
MHEDQVHIDAGIARQLVIDNFPQYRSGPIQLVNSQGTVNTIFRVGCDAAARFPLRVADPRQLEAELERDSKAMVEFAEWCPFPTPEPLGIGRPGRSFPLPWSMQTWIEGEVTTPAGISASPTFSNDVAFLIESLRNADMSGRTFTGTGRGGRISDHDDWVQTCFRNSGTLLDVEKLRSIWERLRELPPTFSEAMSHKDLIPANIVVREERIIGVLDAGDFGPADPALDLVAVWHHLDEERRDLVRNRLSTTRGEWLRGAAWAFQQAIGLVWYYRLTNPRMSELGRSTLQRLVDDSEISGELGKRP